MYTFDKFNDALHRAEHERPIFRVVINVTDWAKQNGFDRWFLIIWCVILTMVCNIKYEFFIIFKRETPMSRQHSEARNN